MNRMLRFLLVFFSVGVLAAFLAVTPQRTIGDHIRYVYLSPGESRMYSDSGRVFYGEERYGTLYFFLPSYTRFNHIEYDPHGYRLLDSEGNIMTEPVMNDVIDCLVDTGSGEPIQYRVGFYTSENLYTIEIDTGDKAVEEIEWHDYSDVAMRVISTKGEETFYSNRIRMKGRGNTSWEQTNKKPYEIKTPQDEALCGMKPSDKWVLLSNAMDDTKIQNKLALDLARKIGMEYAIESDWVDLYINGEYRGNYLLCKEPSIGKTDLNIRNLQKVNAPFFDKGRIFQTETMKGYIYDRNPDDITGGYLVEQNLVMPMEKKDCAFTIDNANYYMKSPDNASREELTYMKDIILRAKDDPYSTTDWNSFVKRYLIEEFLFNSDSGCASWYFYKKSADELLYAGPCWDYDQAGGQYKDKGSYDGTILENAGMEMDNSLMEHLEYRGYVSKIFRESEEFFKEIVEQGIDDYYGKIDSSLVMDEVKWRGQYKTRYKDIYNNRRLLKLFLHKRLEYLADRYDVAVELKDPDIYEKCERHLSFIFDNGDIIEMTVPDGKQLKMEEIPEPDGDTDSWEIEDTEEELTVNLPVFEDMVLRPHIEEE